MDGANLNKGQDINDTEAKIFIAYNFTC